MEADRRGWVERRAGLKGGGRNIWRQAAEGGRGGGGRLKGGGVEAG